MVIDCMALRSAGRLRARANPSPQLRSPPLFSGPAGARCRACWRRGGQQPAHLLPAAAAAHRGCVECMHQITCARALERAVQNSAHAAMQGRPCPTPHAPHSTHTAPTQQQASCSKVQQLDSMDAACCQHEHDAWQSARQACAHADTCTTTQGCGAGTQLMHTGRPGHSAGAGTAQT